LNKAKAVELGNSFSAWRYRKWMDKTMRPVPDFFNGIGFEALKSHQKQSKTEPPSRAGY
jgi:hypothetical protein